MTAGETSPSTGVGSWATNLPVVARFRNSLDRVVSGETLRAWGPAWLVMIADVDAASILTGLESGIAYRYDLVWFLVMLIVPLFFVQEAAGRIGAVTHKGLGELVRETRSSRASVALAVPVALADVASYVAEYAAIGLAFGIFGVPLYLSLPVAFVVHIGLVARGKYAWLERILLGVSAVFVVTVGSALLVRGVLPYSPVVFSANPSFVFLLAANAGAVVMPFMLFYQSSATAEKAGSTIRGVRRETLIGAVVSELLMVAFLMLGAGMPASADLFTSSGAAAALASVGGWLLPYAFAIGLIAAAFLALVVISLGSAWGVVEAVGLPRRRAFWVYTAESVPAVIIPFLYPHPLALVLDLMVLLVFILIAPGVLVGLLASDERVMGSKASRGFWKGAYWVSLASVVLCGVVAVL
ncbi:MAG TPA: divalent metal cation transporter [Thermoplasmata archaeon]|nr:divalent metal cation transporter [Thermoplasmata archaeon]